MKKTIVTVALAFCAITAPAQNKVVNGYIQLPGGVEYKLAKDAPGSEKPANGDFVETNMYVVVDGNTIYSSPEAMKGKPVGFMMQKSTTPTDIQEVIRLLTVGDSAVIRFSVDSLLKTGVQQYDWMRPNTGQKATYLVKMLRIKTMGRKEEKPGTN